tara:strand:- start:9 stop:290 length:282 start_codon:yes stop_codon:yes gene_type:complete
MTELEQYEKYMHYKIKNSSKNYDKAIANIPPMEKKRRGYLNYFKLGITDALLNVEASDKLNSSAYYRQGYSFGLTLQARLEYANIKSLKGESE